MRDSPAFLNAEWVIAIHERMIAEFGGDDSLRNMGLLESAVGVPAARYAGKWLHRDIAGMAAAYLFHICRNHPFVDGNKRTALAAAEVFLDLNGYQLRATNIQVEALTLGVAEGNVSKDETLRFFRERATRRMPASST
jgi:death on curing protein